MGDFIELGLEGADKLIDKHFHKVPDKYTDPATYKPKRMRKGSKDQSGSSQEPSDTRSRKHHHRRPVSPPYPTSDSGMAYESRPRDNGANSSPYLQDGPFVTAPLYSHLPPHQRPEYIPDSPLRSMDRNPRDRSRYDDDVDDDYSSPPRRPVALRRRSSSYHGPRGDDYFYSSDDNDRKQIAHQPRRTGSHADIRDKARDKAKRYDIENEVKNQFTRSKEGIAGGVVGALVGGWAAHKAVESRGRGHHGTGDVVWTALGAAAGGLAVNAIVDKWEDKNNETKEKQEKWEEKFGGRDDRRDDRYDDRKSSSGRSRRDDRSRRHDDGYYR